MTHDEILKMLNIQPPSDGKAAPEANESVLDIESVDEQHEGFVPASDSALVLDQWQRMRGEELAAVDKIHGFIPDDPVAVADFHTAAFELEPELVERCTNELRHNFIKTMMETPEYKELHTHTQLNPLSSELATVSFAEQYCQLIKDIENSDKSGGGEQGRDRINRRRVRKGISNAAKEVEDLESMQDAFGLGGNGGADGKMDTAGVAQLFQRVRSDKMLRRICELAGKYRRLAQSKQRQKTFHGQDDMVGVTLDNEISKLLATELMLMEDSLLEMDMLRRFVSKQTMCRDYRGIEHVAKGPIVVVVDESGSMGGEKIANAKALALAMAYIAKAQHRWCALVGFSGGTEGTRLVLPPGKWDQMALIEWLTHFYGGGTTVDVPLVELPTTYWDEFIAKGATRGKTDIVMITDGIVDVPDDVHHKFMEWKHREHVSLTTLIIDERQAGDLGHVSDSVHLIKNLTVECEAVGEVLSV